MGTERKRIRLVLFLILFSTISITLSGIYGNGGYFRYKQLCIYENRLQDELKRIEAETSDLEHQLQELQDKEFCIEKIAREEFGLTKPGEIVIYFKETNYPGIISVKN
ncbi:MAG: hypothetical protein A2161_00920 [Candidatus Schekmanbacteria bacterium RBG_13_48_7]|uniref:Cell division protein FtsB n=1 Tax=Candidatus Schekmanbacteria bacterium RBG_13_48_7 TaxID=1817878 RepID=A0A1F7RYL4_9BACT|nr:MAG: hypothetical protein A2161_00920 [Candidatus Schekmanbacteria bacterium RBG_13_48_7]